MDWDPTQFFRTDAPPSPFALLVLNQPINEKAFLVLRERGTLALTPVYYRIRMLTKEKSKLHNLRRRRRKPFLRSYEEKRP